jgi:hypothetical protein
VLGIAAPIVPFGPAAHEMLVPNAQMRASAEKPDRAKVPASMIASKSCHYCMPCAAKLSTIRIGR